MLTHKAIRELLGKTTEDLSEMNITGWSHGSGKRENQEYIVESRTIIRQLLKEVEELDLKLASSINLLGIEYATRYVNVKNLEEGKSIAEARIEEESHILEAQRLIEGGK